MFKKAKQCVLCGANNTCGMLVMGQYICLDCQPLLDDPNRRVFGCSLNRRIARGKAHEELALAKAKD